MQGYTSVLAKSPGADGPTLANTTTKTSILHPSGKWNMPGSFITDFMAGLGTKFWFNVRGRISTVVTAPGTLTLGWQIGSVAVFTSQALALNIVAKTNVTFEYEGEMDLTAIGSGANTTLRGIGKFLSEASINTAVSATGPGPGGQMVPASAPANGTAFDPSVAALWDLFATWSTANAANSITVHSSVLVGLN